MGIFDKAENEAENLAEKDPNLTDKGLNELGQEVNQMTGDRFGNQINEGVQAAENRLGQQGGDQNQGQDQDQDQGQSQG
jgi:MT0933-like antitoxin protein